MHLNAPVKIPVRLVGPSAGSLKAQVFVTKNTSIRRFSDNTRVQADFSSNAGRANLNPNYFKKGSYRDAILSHTTHALSPPNAVNFALLSLSSILRTDATTTTSSGSLFQPTITQRQKICFSTLQLHVPIQSFPHFLLLLHSPLPGIGRHDDPILRPVP